MIISGGENIYPVEVETVLDGHEAIDEVAVVGIDDERWNQIVTAFVIIPEGPEDIDFSSLGDQLDTYCRESDDLANFKRPRKYVFVDELVKSNVEKVLRWKRDIDDLDIKVCEISNI